MYYGTRIPTKNIFFSVLTPEKMHKNQFMCIEALFIAQLFISITARCSTRNADVSTCIVIVIITLKQPFYIIGNCMILYSSHASIFVIYTFVTI